MSSSPRTALTGVPSGALTESGTPKNARKYSDAVSSSRSFSVVGHDAIVARRRAEAASFVAPRAWGMTAEHSGPPPEARAQSRADVHAGARIGSVESRA